MLIRDHHGAYISWERYLKNQEQMQGNMTMRNTADAGKRGLDGEPQARALGFRQRVAQRFAGAAHGRGGRRRRAHPGCQNPWKLSGTWWRRRMRATGPAPSPASVKMAKSLRRVRES